MQYANLKTRKAPIQAPFAFLRPAIGAQPMDISAGPMELRQPAVKGIGGAPL